MGVSYGTALSGPGRVLGQLTPMCYRHPDNLSILGGIVGLDYDRGAGD